MSKKNPRFRFSKVISTFDSADAKLLELYSKSLGSANVRNVVLASSADIRKNDDDNTALIQRDLSSSSKRIENVLEKVLYTLCISLLINVVVSVLYLI